MHRCRKQDKSFYRLCQVTRRFVTQTFTIRSINACRNLHTGRLLGLRLQGIRAMAEHVACQALSKQLVDEVVEEQVIELLGEAVIASDIDFDLDQRNNQVTEKDIAIQVLSTSLVNEVIVEQFVALCEECFDDIIALHFKDSIAVHSLNDVLLEVSHQMVQEVVLELIDVSKSQVYAEQILDSVVTDFLTEECEITAAKVLDHYRARVALLQYKQMQVSASNALMDAFLLESLLFKYRPITEDNSQELMPFEVHEYDSVMDRMVLDVLVSQTLSLHTCLHKEKHITISKLSPTSPRQPTDCLPLKWYKKKLFSGMAEDVVLSLLCDRLDESIQIAEEKHVKDMAVSMFTQFIDTPK